MKELCCNRLKVSSLMYVSFTDSRRAKSIVLKSLQVIVLSTPALCDERLKKLSIGRRDRARIVACHVSLRRYQRWTGPVRTHDC